MKYFGSISILKDKIYLNNYNKLVINIFAGQKGDHIHHLEREGCCKFRLSKSYVVVAKK